ncbi:TetR/AcrR family transcriptional regulator [Curtobacterium sp. MCPF17_011]|uniref:TetR/AcrR family transcriptional regulator n=1 Tax=Curtobacterium sp. MCPF17_011 TaxID=2175652 RepID=UPI0015E8A79B|nr:TetR family transcriptional regulator [Curtobacterium sp. MCPF17_011]
MRADAAANKAKIVDAARRVLESGVAPGMAAVARAAAVGQGTIYRHFPTWEDLVIEVHRADMNELAAAAPGLLRAHPPVEALHAWLRMLADYGRLKDDTSDAMTAVLHEALGRAVQTPDLGALRTLLAAGQADGSIRSDLSAEDVFLLVGFLWRLDRAPDRTARAERMLDAVMRGLQVIDSGPSADERTDESAERVTGSEAL